MPLVFENTQDDPPLLLDKPAFYLGWTSKLGDGLVAYGGTKKIGLRVQRDSQWLSSRYLRRNHEVEDVHRQVHLNAVRHSELIQRS